MLPKAAGCLSCVQNIFQLSKPRLICELTFSIQAKHASICGISHEYALLQQTSLSSRVILRSGLVNTSRHSSSETVAAIAVQRKQEGAALGFTNVFSLVPCVLDCCKVGIFVLYVMVQRS